VAAKPRLEVLGIPAECFRGTDAADVMTRLLLEHVTSTLSRHGLQEARCCRVLAEKEGCPTPKPSSRHHTPEGDCEVWASERG